MRFTIMWWICKNVHTLYASTHLVGLHHCSDLLEQFAAALTERLQNHATRLPGRL